MIESFMRVQIDVVKWELVEYLNGEVIAVHLFKHGEDAQRFSNRWHEKRMEQKHKVKDNDLSNGCWRLETRLINKNKLTAVAEIKI